MFRGYVERSAHVTVKRASNSGFTRFSRYLLPVSSAFSNRATVNGTVTTARYLVGNRRFVCRQIATVPDGGKPYGPSNHRILNEESGRPRRGADRPVPGGLRNVRVRAAVG